MGNRQNVWLMGNGWEIGEFLGKSLGFLVIFRKILGNLAFSKKSWDFLNFPRKFLGFLKHFFHFP